MIIKSGAPNFKVDAMHLSWMLTVLLPSLPITTQLEAGLTKMAELLTAGLGEGSSFELRWKEFNIYKSDHKKDKELT